MKKVFSFWFLFLLLTSVTGLSQQYKAGVIAFYNLENLFDTENDPNIRDDEYTPEGSKSWTQERYEKKLDNMAEVISRLGEDELGDRSGPSILGMAEIENRRVLEDLVANKKLESMNYGIVHYDSPDKRGIDVCMLYRKDVFEVTSSRAVPFTVEDKEDFKSRDILVVTGNYDGEKMDFIVCHWPSRYGGEKKSRPMRIAAAKLTKHLADSIQNANNSEAKIFIMGDFNDDPTNHSIKEYLNTSDDKKDLDNDELYNPYLTLYKKGIGTLAYRDKWNLFDQIILSQELLEDDGEYRFIKAKVYNKKWLMVQDGRYKGYPKRTHVGSNYQGGYSDHFPVYVIIGKKIDDD
ncbi:endonuclease/exonuclease/phosphatase family protein [Aureibacter tunicatorum]|uniref:Exonuclease III n=1 Tax=Aureibacter tunicatorum TaxID=866807 RepID=A0AAE4BUY7_9BACT|nr:endonuclease/exonuclease/phosphatase family protein [Aureibacter tunicatorum]MDR6241540.1 exonuclease III [Aureibacter tunicatorum]